MASCCVAADGCAIADDEGCIVEGCSHDSVPALLPVVGRSACMKESTVLTKKRISIPVPAELADEFRVETGSQEFFVRFDLLSNDTDFRTD
jgi:hypothetical protein